MDNVTSVRDGIALLTGKWSLDDEPVRKPPVANSKRGAGMRCYDETNPHPESNSWLKAYLDHQRYSESPEQFHFWTGVSTIAGALRRRVWIDQRHFQWTPNMYIVLVGPPGVAAKSTSLRAGLSMLERVPDITFGPQSMTWQALIKSFKRSQSTISVPGSATPVTMSCITTGVSELGTFLNPEDREFMDLLTAMWDGQKEVYRRETKGDGQVELINPWLNLIGCTTPSWLTKNFPEDLVGGGLTSRIVFVYGEKKRQLVAYPAEAITDADYLEEEKALVHDLAQISELVGPYILTPEALRWGERWYASHNNGGLPAHLASGRFDGYVARKQTHIHKLAMVLAASRRSHLRIEPFDLQDAERYISELETDMLQVFNSIGVSKEAKVTNEVLALIRNYRKIDVQTLWRQCIKTHKPEDFKKSILAAIEAGYVKKEPLGKDNHMLTFLGGKR